VHTPLVLGHRGASRRARENTLEAFLLARELGADGVELDVRRSADGVLVVHHDPALDGLGVLAERPFDELRRAAPWIPTLAESLDVLDGVLVNVEVKCLPHEPDADPAHEVARAVVEEIHRRDLASHVIVSSFWLETVDAVRGLDREIATAWLTGGQAPAAAAPVAAAHGHGWLNPDTDSVLADAPDAALRAAHDAGVRVGVWTVDDPEEVRRLADAGVDAVITNVPDVAIAAITAPRG